MYVQEFIKMNIHPIIMLSEKIQAIIAKAYTVDRLKRIDPVDIILQNQTEVKELVKDFSDAYKDFDCEGEFLNEKTLEQPPKYEDDEPYK